MAREQKVPVFSQDEHEATMRVGAVGLGNTVVVCVAIVIKSGWSGQLGGVGRCPSAVAALGSAPRNTE